MLRAALLAVAQTTQTFERVSECISQKTGKRLFIVTLFTVAPNLKSPKCHQPVVYPVNGTSLSNVKRPLLHATTWINPAAKVW